MRKKHRCKSPTAGNHERRTSSLDHHPLVDSKTQSHGIGMNTAVVDVRQSASTIQFRSRKVPGTDLAAADFLSEGTLSLGEYSSGSYPRGRAAHSQTAVEPELAQLDLDGPMMIRVSYCSRLSQKHVPKRYYRECPYGLQAPGLGDLDANAYLCVLQYNIPLMRFRT